MDDKEILKSLQALTKDRQIWDENIDYVAGFLSDDYSAEVQAKSLWLSGEMGLKHPEKIAGHVDKIAVYMQSENPKLRERSLNALGRIGRGDENLTIPYLEEMFVLRFDSDENVRHAFIWACENIASKKADIFCDKMEIFDEMLEDTSDKVRIEAPEIFRVISKQNPECVKPYCQKLKSMAENDENPTVRIHAAGAVRVAEKK